MKKAVIFLKSKLRLIIVGFLYALICLSCLESYSQRGRFILPSFFKPTISRTSIYRNNYSRYNSNVYNISNYNRPSTHKHLGWDLYEYSRLGTKEVYQNSSEKNIGNVFEHLRLGRIGTYPYQDSDRKRFEELLSIDSKELRELREKIRIVFSDDIKFYLKKPFDLSVLLIQKELNRKKGYNLVEDGIYGKKTENALIDFSSLSSIKKEDYLKLSKETLEGKGVLDNKEIIVQTLSTKIDNSSLNLNSYIEGRNHILSTFDLSSLKDYSVFEDFYKNFLNQIDFDNLHTYEEISFVMFNKIGNKEYVTLLKKVEANFYGMLYELKNSDKFLTSFFEEIKEKKKIVIYGNYLPSVGETIINNKSLEVICRKPTTSLPINNISDFYSQFSEKKINFRKTTVLNGLPTSKEEIEAQSFEIEGLKVYKDLKENIDAKITEKVKALSNDLPKFITTKDALINELVNGEDDLLVIFGHSDGNSIYLGSESISVEEINALDTRKTKVNGRVAILFCCVTANIFEEKKWYQPFKKMTNTIGEALLNKKFVNFVVAPRANINGNQVMIMLEQLDKQSIIQYRNQYISTFFNLAQKNINFK